MEERRSFLKKSGLIVLGLAASGVACPARSSRADSVNYGMVIDLDRCTGCQSCVIVCKGQNRTTKGFFNTVVEVSEQGSYPDSRFVFTPRQCNQCEEPPCVDACSHDATFKLANGIVVTDWQKCRADGDCVDACPYGARFQDPESGGRADKCDLCIVRINKGLEPACVEACPAGARIFGNLAAPRGEFAEYIKNRALTPQFTGADTALKVLYSGNVQG